MNGLKELNKLLLRDKESLEVKLYSKSNWFVLKPFINTIKLCFQHEFSIFSLTQCKSEYNIEDPYGLTEIIAFTKDLNTNRNEWKEHYIIVAFNYNRKWKQSKSSFLWEKLLIRIPKTE